MKLPTSILPSRFTTSDSDGGRPPKPDAETEEQTFELDRQTATVEFENGVGKCYNCTTRFEVGQCEGCDDHYAEPDMTTENVPGATLWFCPDCATTRGVAYQ